MTKLNVKDDAGIVREAITEGLVEIEHKFFHINHMATQITLPL